MDRTRTVAWLLFIPGYPCLIGSRAILLGGPGSRDPMGNGLSHYKDQFQANLLATQSLLLITNSMLGTITYGSSW